MTMRTVKYIDFIKVLAIISVSTVISGTLYAADEKKVQGVDLVTDTAAAVVTKAFAILSGDLEVTMKPEEDKAKKKENYTENALGEMVPKATVTK